MPSAPPPRTDASTTRYLLLGLVHDLVVRLDRVVLLVRALRVVLRTLVRRARRRLLPSRLRALRVQRLPRLAVRLFQLLARRADLSEIVRAQRLPRALHRAFELRLHVRAQTVRPLLRVLLDLVGERVEPV